MKKLLFLTLLTISFSSMAQQNVDIVTIIDDLTVRWDRKAIELKDYQGVQNFCATLQYREETVDLLDKIHHWDTTLYFIVQNKYEVDQDKEAASTLEDIEKLETEYTTEKFKLFIQEECNLLKEIEGSFRSETVKQYEKDIKKFEKELVKYVNSITYRIDIIDDHIHHLKWKK